MTIPKEYNHNTSPPTLMNPWDYQVEAEVKARFGIDKPRSTFNPTPYMRAVAEVIQDHGTDLSFAALKYHVGDFADPRTRSGCHYVIVSSALNPDGSVNDPTVVVGHGATLAFCNALKELIEGGTLQVFRSEPLDCSMRFYPNNDAPLAKLAAVNVIKGPCPVIEPPSTTAH